MWELYKNEWHKLEDLGEHAADCPRTQQRQASHENLNDWRDSLPCLGM